MAKFKGKKMVAFVAAEDVTSNMYTDCLGPKKRIKYIVYLITDGSIELSDAKKNLFEEYAQKKDVKPDDVEEFKSIAVKHADKSTGILFVGATLKDTYESLKKNSLIDMVYGIGYSPDSLSAQNVDFYNAEMKNGSNMQQEFFEALSDPNIAKKMQASKTDMTSKDSISKTVNTGAEKKADSLTDAMPEYQSVEHNKVNENGHINSQSSKKRKTDGARTDYARPKSKENVNPGDPSSRKPNIKAEQKQENEEYNIHMLEDEIFGTNITGGKTEDEDFYTPLQNAKATLFSELMKRLEGHIKLYTNLDLQEEQSFRFSILLEKTNNADEFNQNWNISEPIFKVGLKDDDFIRLKTEAVYFDKVSKMIYGEDLWEY